MLSEKSIGLQPRHIGGLQSLAKNLFLQGRNEEALQAYQKAMEASGRNVVIIVPYANMLSQLGQHQDALELAREVASRQDMQIMAHIQAWHGFIARQAGESSEAIEALKAAVALHPGEQKYRKLLKDYRFENSLVGRMREAVARLRRKNQSPSNSIFR